MEIIHNHPEFVTATIAHWQHLLQEDENKELILQSLSFLVREERIIAVLVGVPGVGGSPTIAPINHKLLYPEC